MNEAKHILAKPRFWTKKERWLIKILVLLNRDGIIRSDSLTKQVEGGNALPFAFMCVCMIGAHYDFDLQLGFNLSRFRRAHMCPRKQKKKIKWVSGAGAWSLSLTQTENGDQRVHRARTRDPRSHLQTLE